MNTSSTTQMENTFDISPTPSSDVHLPFVKHPNLYYPDGNVCLLANSTVFRCLRSMLAKESGGLNELFEGLSEGSNYDIYEGAPIVKVEGSTSDWETLLSFLWKGRLAILTSRESWAILRVAHAYHFQEAQQLILKDLKASLSPSSPATTLDKYRSQTSRAVDCIQNARSCQAAELLPLAFYAVAFYVMNDRTSFKDVTAMGIDMDDVVRLQIGRQQIKARWWRFVELGPDFITCNCPPPPAPAGTGGNKKPQVNVAPPAKITTVELSKALKDEGDPLYYLKPGGMRSAPPKYQPCAECQIRQPHTRSVYWDSIIKDLPTLFSL